MLWKYTVCRAFVIVTFHVTFETVLSAKCLLTAVTGAEEGSFTCRNEEAASVSPPGKLSPSHSGKEGLRSRGADPLSLNPRAKESSSSSSLCLGGRLLASSWLFLKGMSGFMA